MFGVKTFRFFRDIQSGMVGARGFKADYALLVTWERMGYGGAPKIVDITKMKQAKTEVCQ